VSGRVLVGYARKPKLSGAAVGRPLSSGVVVAPAVLWTATIMLATTLPYVIAQGVAFGYGGSVVASLMVAVHSTAGATTTPLKSGRPTAAPLSLGFLA
jgi:hypothetical protein